MLGEILSEQYQMTVVDMEAGLEHLSRSGGTLQHVDMILIVLEPYRKALETARRTHVLSQELGIPLIYGIASKARDDADIAAVQDFATAQGLELLASIPFDEAVRVTDRDGGAIIDIAPDGPAVTAVSGLLDEVERVWADTQGEQPKIAVGE